MLGPILLLSSIQSHPDSEASGTGKSLFIMYILAYRAFEVLCAFFHTKRVPSVITYVQTEKSFLEINRKETSC